MANTTIQSLQANSENFVHTACVLAEPIFDMMKHAKNKKQGFRSEFAKGKAL